MRPGHLNKPMTRSEKSWLTAIIVLIFAWWSLPVLAQFFSTGLFTGGGSGPPPATVNSVTFAGSPPENIALQGTVQWTVASSPPEQIMEATN